MFNPRPTIRYIPIGENQVCAVIDDFLLDPQKMVDFAVAQQAQFAKDVDNYYPGPELPLSREIACSLDGFFIQHVRHALNARRNLGVSCRLSMATLATQQLHPLQRLCHRDADVFPSGVSIGASVLYLFKDPALGGTSFYSPKKSLDELRHLMKLANTVSNEELTRIINTAPSYMTKSNAYFDQVCTVPAAWNRAIFYSGTIFHAAQIDRPELLNTDPAKGRLTLNGFFKLRLSSAAISVGV
ncbi:MAG: DUF6445 family protein [Burkholderiales bacterium]|nr:DUF6445 family protein [Burkholderiales bacterium]